MRCNDFADQPPGKEYHFVYNMSNSGSEVLYCSLSRSADVCYLSPSATGEKNGDHSLWVRPLVTFMETVTVAGREVPRFALVVEK